MVEHLTLYPGRIVASAILAITAGLASFSVAAQTDPMRPPDVPSGASGNVDTTALSSILISDRRTEAVIGGKTVRVGSTVGQARVEKITAGEVILRDENGIRTMKLFPGIQKHIIGSGVGEDDGTKRNGGEKRKK